MDNITYLKNSHAVNDEFIKATYKIFASTLLIATVGVLIGLYNLDFVVTYIIGLFIVAFASVAILCFVFHHTHLAIPMLFVFTFTTGLLTAGSVAKIASQSLPLLVTTFASATIIFGLASIFGVRYKRTVQTWTTLLFYSVLGLIALAVVADIYHIDALSLSVSIITLFVFTGYVAHDTANIIDGKCDSPLEGAVMLYLDVLNIFTALCNLLSFSKKD